MKKIVYLLLLTAVIISCNKDDNNPETTPEVVFIPEFVVELVPRDDSLSVDLTDRSKNVIQGIASFEGGWFTSQNSQNKYGDFLILNYLNSEGVSLFNIKIEHLSHGQDLSLEPVSDTEVYLYTGEGADDLRGSGMVRLLVTLPAKDESGNRDMSQLVIEVDKSYDLDYINSTPTISEDYMQYAVRSNQTIHVLSKQNVEDSIFNVVDYRFQLGSEQLVDNLGGTMWFQGIALKDGIVYCLTGDNKVSSVKKLFLYDTNGAVFSKSTFTFDDFGLEAKTKLEPESLSFVGDDLYMCMMTDIPNVEGGNLKFLYKLNIKEQ